MKYTQKQLNEMKPDQLNQMLKELRGKLRQLRFLASHGELRQIHEIAETRKSVARVLGQIKQLSSKADTGEKSEPLTEDAK